jgi:hypothetical protein
MCVTHNVMRNTSNLVKPSTHLQMCSLQAPRSCELCHLRLCSSPLPSAQLKLEPHQLCDGQTYMSVTTRDGSQQHSYFCTLPRCTDSYWSDPESHLLSASHPGAEVSNQNRFGRDWVQECGCRSSSSSSSSSRSRSIEKVLIAYLAHAALPGQGKTELMLES